MKMPITTEYRNELRDRYRQRAAEGFGVPKSAICLSDDLAALLFAQDLIQGDPATFKAGYTAENAYLSACEAFPFIDRKQLGSDLGLPHADRPDAGPDPMHPKIESREDAVRWMHSLAEGGLNFHPDTDFSDYVHADDGSQCFRTDAIARLNAAMDRCGDFGDPSEIALEAIEADQGAAATTIDEVLS